jgi:ABC-type branched-subunit amino acid transport system substrate-binding protein
MDIKIGALLPASKEFPGAARDYLQGIKLSLSHSGMEGITWSQVIVGLGESEDVIQEKLQELLLNGDPDIVVSYSGEYTSPALSASLQGLGLPGICSSMGAVVPHLFEPHPMVFHHGLNFWLDARAIARVVLEEAKKAGWISSIYESGYMMHTAYWDYMEQGGATLSLFHTKPMELEEPDAVVLQKQLFDYAPESLLALFSGKEAGKFYKVFSTLQRNFDPYWVMPLMTMNDVLQMEGANAKGAASIASWHPQFPGERNAKFVESWRSKNGSDPTAFTFLGYEAGELIASALKGQDTFDKNKFVQNLKSAEHETVRGKVCFTPNLQLLLAPQRFITIEEGNKVVIGNEVSPESIGVEDIVATFKGKSYAAWKNNYPLT